MKNSLSPVFKPALTALCISLASCSSPIEYKPEEVQRAAEIEYNGEYINAKTSGLIDAIQERISTVTFCKGSSSNALQYIFIRDPEKQTLVKHVGRKVFHQFMNVGLFNDSSYIHEVPRPFWIEVNKSRASDSIHCEDPRGV